MYLTVTQTSMCHRTSAWQANSTAATVTIRLWAPRWLCHSSVNILQIEMRQRPLFSFPFFFVTLDYTLQVDCDHTHFTMQTHDDSTITFDMKGKTWDILMRMQTGKHSLQEAALRRARLVKHIAMLVQWGCWQWLVLRGERPLLELDIMCISISSF